MIVGRTKSADGGFRRIPIRHTQIVDSETRSVLIHFLNKIIIQACEKYDWVGTSDLFPNIPEDIINTPLRIVYDKCVERFKDSPKSLRINLLKYLGMLVREAVYYSEVRFYEQLDGSVRKFSFESKGLEHFSVETNRQRAINGQDGGKK